MAKYQVAPGCSLPGGQKHVQKVGETLESLPNLHTKTIVEEAKKETSPLHRHFTWDRDEAAKKCWRREAHYLRKAVQVVFKHKDGSDAPVRAFVTLEPISRREPVFMKIEDVLNDPEARARHLENALADLRVWELRYELLSELSEIFKVAGKVRKDKLPDNEKKTP